jgi:hypothetical protein
MECLRPEEFNPSIVKLATQHRFAKPDAITQGEMRPLRNPTYADA